MNVLVVGGAGYVGSVLVRELLAKGHAVGVYDSLLFGKEGLTAVQSHIQLKIGDIRQITSSELEGFDAVINLGGISSDPTAEFKPNLTYEMNVVGAVRIARMCKEVGIRRYLFASSCSVYDAQSVDDQSDVLLDESSDIYPTSAYATSKLEAERQVSELADESFQPVFLRKGTIYGFSTRMRYDLVINTLLKDVLACGYMTIHSGGEMWRPVLEIRDAAKAYIVCLEAEDSAVQSQVFNVVFENYRVCEMALRIRETFRELGTFSDIRAEYTQKKVRSYRVSGHQMEERLGFRPQISIEDSVTRMIAKIAAHGMKDYGHSRHYNTRWLEDLT